MALLGPSAGSEKDPAPPLIITPSGTTLGVRYNTGVGRTAAEHAGAGPLWAVSCSGRPHWARVLSRPDPGTGLQAMVRLGRVRAGK